MFFLQFNYIYNLKIVTGVTDFYTKPMIKLFKKIRYKQIKKNKTGKYLKYAIGEILLVVIGILIVLSVNN